MIPALELVAIFLKCLEDHWGYIWGTAGILWTQARQAALEKTTDENRAMGRKYGARWIGHMVADCSGMFVYAFKKYGLGMSYISSNIYKSYCTKTKGKLTAELKKTIRPGTAVFTGKTAGNHPHVGLYVGNGEVVEAAGTKQGVIKSKLSDDKWTFYGELKNVQYDGAAPEPSPEPAPDPDKRPTLRRGSNGAYVIEMQSMLNRLGYGLGPCGVDGDFGRSTQSAVEAFQYDQKITIDGICGPTTWKKLDEAFAKLLNPDPVVKTYTVTIRGLSLDEADALVMKYPDATASAEGSGQK